MIKFYEETYNKIDLSKSITIEGSVITFPNKNRVYIDDDGSCVLEEYAFTNASGEDMFSVFEAFPNLETAIKYGSVVTEKNHNHYMNKWINEREGNKDV